MFETADQESFDIVALNIQRGRDHGIRPYTDWRDYCGLSEILNFNGMDSASRVYQRAYEGL